MAVALPLCTTPDRRLFTLLKCQEKNGRANTTAHNDRLACLMLTAAWSRHLELEAGFALPGIRVKSVFYTLKNPAT